METTTLTYRITTKSGVAIANDLHLASPAIQLQEGVVSKGDKHPKDLSIGESSIVRYPLVQGELLCRVTRIDGPVPIASLDKPIEFVEPDPSIKSKPKVTEMSVAQADAVIAAAKERATEEFVKVRRRRGKVASA